MSQANVNGITIEYETLGDPGGRPLLLVVGLGSQLIDWSDEFCAMLVEHGHYVIRYDNRDAGLSTKIEAAGVPNLFILRESLASGETPPPYTLEDMAADGIGLLDALGIPAAHVVGASLGGMIAQLMAIRFPERVLSLTSMRSTTGARDLPPGKPEAIFALATPAPPGREGYIDHMIWLRRIIGTPDPFLDDPRMRVVFGARYDRSYYPDGPTRQLAAIIAAPSRREALTELRIPTLVVHGSIDPIIPPDAGVDTAASVPGAELIIFDDVGHDLPAAHWRTVVDAISTMTARVGQD